MSNRNTALYDAIDRDLDDAERLDHLEALVSTWIDALIPEVAPLNHPRARWYPSELMDALTGALIDIRGERWRVSHGPVVLEDAA